MATHTVLLPNAHGRVTRHHFVRLELRAGLGVVPVFECEMTGDTRAYGCLEPRLTRKKFEEIYGPLQLDYWPGCVRAWVVRVADADEEQPIAA